jgi:hypothetical protein
MNPFGLQLLALYVALKDGKTHTHPFAGHMVVMFTLNACPYRVVQTRASRLSGSSGPLHNRPSQKIGGGQESEGDSECVRGTVK